MKRILDTSHLEGDLGKRTVHGGVAIAITRILNFILSMGSTAILARLLTPEDYGIFAMVMAFLGFVTMFQDMGLSMATIQRKNVTHQQVSNLFWINFSIGIFIAAVIVVCSPLIGWFYKDSRVTLVSSILSISIVFSSLSIQHQAIARRAMKFWHIQGAILGGVIAGIIVAIVMAYQNFGYWALVWQRIIRSAVTCGILWIVIPWFPRLPRRGAGVRDMITFGFHIAISRFVRQTKSLIDKILIGTFSGAVSLGLYSKAFNLLILPIQQFNNPISVVFIPALSRLQNDKNKFQRFYYRGIGLVASISIPTIILLALIADKLIPLFLGPRWNGVIILFQAMAPAAIIQSLDLTKGWATIPLGQSRRIMICNILDSMLTIVFLCIGIKWGALGIALSLSIISIIKFIPLNLFALKESPITLKDIFFNSLAWPIFYSILAGIGLIIFRWTFSVNNYLLSLILDFIIFGLIYIGLPFIIPGGRKIFYPLRDVLIMIVR